MAQPFEQVLESLRAIASGKLGQLEERSKAYLTEIKTTIESRVESEKVKAKERTSRAARAKKKTVAKNATPVDDVEEEDDVAHGEKENTAAVTRSSRRTRSSAKAASNALCDATNTNVDAEDAGDASSKQPARSSRRLRSKKATTSAPPVASSGRMTRSRARKQAQVLETIVETTENDDTSPEQSPDLGKRDEEMEEQEKTPPTPPPAKRSAKAEAEVVTDKSAAAVEDVAKVPAKAKADKPQKQPTTRKSVAAATRAARKKDLPSQDDTAPAKSEDEAKVAPREDQSEPEPRVRRKSTRQRRGSAKPETEITAEAKTTEAVQENPVEEVEKAVDAAKSDPDKAAGGKKRGRPRTKPVRQRGAAKQAPAEEKEEEKEDVAIPEADMAARNPKKARKSAPKPETKAQDSKASASAEAPAEPNRKLRRRTRSSRMVEEERGAISMEAAPAVQQQEQQQEEEQEAVVPEDKEKAAHEEFKMEAHLTPGEPAKGSPASARLAEERQASAIGSGAEPVGKPKIAPLSMTPDVRLEAMAAATDLKLPKDTKATQEKAAMAIQEPVHCPPNATEVLETEAAATKKAVQAAKSGGLRNMMSLLSPENEDGAGEARTLSRFDQAADASELAGAAAKGEQRPAAQGESSEQKQPGFVEKASNVITSVTSFLPSMRKEGGPASRARKPVEVKALKAAEQARKQEALKLEEKMKRREAMKDRAVAARETKQRLEEQKRQQMLLDQQRKGEQMRKRGEEIARKKRDREEESKREREEKKRKVNLELEKKKMAEMQRAQRTAAAAAQKQKQTTAPQSGGLPGTQRHGYLRPGAADAAAHSKTVPPVVVKRVKASALSQKQGQVEAKPVDTRKPIVVICPRKALQPSGIHNNPNLSWQNAALANNTNTHASNPPHGGPTKAKSQQQVNLSAKPNAFAFGSKTAALTQKTPEPFPFKGQAGIVHASSTAKSDKEEITYHSFSRSTPYQKPADPSGVTSYQMTPCRSDSDESDDECRPAKPVPQWAKSRNLSKQLQMQIKIDPDEIFNMDIAKASCSLDDVFKTGKPKVFRRRGSSGDWNRDRLNWKEEWIYKQAMGYATSDV